MPSPPASRVWLNPQIDAVIAFISDIHSNLAALTAVLDDIDALGTVERIYCLGDVVGYGPQPRECLDVVAERCKLILMGNHEHALLYGAYGFHAAAKRAIDWTRDTLQRVQPASHRKALMELLANEGIPLETRSIDRSELYIADAACPRFPVPTASALISGALSSAQSSIG